MLAWWWLGVLNRRRYDALLQEFGTLDGAFASLSAQMLTELGLRDETIPEVYERLKEFDPGKCRMLMSDQGIELMNITDEEYPRALKEIGDPPVFLSYIGDLSVLGQPLIGVVGTRGMSAYGKRVVEAFVPTFVRAGMVTVSGLALGIDSAVAEQTLQTNGRTVAVLGHGLASIYPASNLKLAQKIVDNGGLILSEFPMNMKPDLYTFPARNRIIAGLSLGTLVCEAPENSGAIITAQLALEYGRDVFAVPGQIFDAQYKGCHLLIGSGQARLVFQPEDVLSEIGVVCDENGTAIPFNPQTPGEETVYRALTTMPQTIDDLLQKTDMDTAGMGAVLTVLELAGAAKNIGAGQWVRR
jgi:DNA processing protein